MGPLLPVDVFPSGHGLDVRVSGRFLIRVAHLDAANHGWFVFDGEINSWLLRVGAHPYRCRRRTKIVTVFIPYLSCLHPT